MSGLCTRKFNSLGIMHPVFRAHLRCAFLIMSGGHHVNACFDKMLCLRETEQGTMSDLSVVSSSAFSDRPPPPSRHVNPAGWPSTVGGGCLSAAPRWLIDSRTSKVAGWPDFTEELAVFYRTVRGALPGPPLYRRFSRCKFLTCCGFTERRVVVHVGQSRKRLSMGPFTPRSTARTPTRHSASPEWGASVAGRVLAPGCGDGTLV